METKFGGRKMSQLSMAILAESGDHRLHNPCEGCTPTQKTAIMIESGEHRLHDPCEGCTPELENPKKRGKQIPLLVYYRKVFALALAYTTPLQAFVRVCLGLLKASGY